MAEKKKKEPAGKEKKGNNVAIWVLLAATVLLGGSFATWKLYLEPKLTPAPCEEKVPARDVPAGQEVLEPSQFVTLDPFIVNLSDPLGRRYLKITMNVEAANALAVTAMNTDMPKIKDALLLLFSSKSFSDIDTIDKKVELKNEVVNRLNLIVGKGKVKNVYFMEFVIQ